MSELYRWPEAQRLCVTFFFALCVLAQSITVVLCWYIRRKGVRRFVESLYEFAILAQVLLCTQIYAELMQNYLAALIPHTGYTVQRTVVFVLLVLSAVMHIMCIDTKAFLKMLVEDTSTVAIAAMTLPPMEALMGKAFAYLYLSVMLYWFVRGCVKIGGFGKELRHGLSGISIKDAMDSLHTGIVFCENDGFAVFTNTQMQRLMLALTGKEQRNGRYFFGLLTLGDIELDCSISWLEEQSVCVLPDGSAWMFGITPLRLGWKDFFQLTATDISQRWELIAQLQPKTLELLRRQEELSQVIGGLELLMRERETQNAKMRAHDILGERLTLLLRVVRNEQLMDYAQLRSLSHGLIDDIKTIQSIPSPQDEIDGLLQVFGTVGVDILIHGNLPEDAEQGHLMTNVIREAAANAVRHGFATQVYVEITTGEEGNCLRITDNGRGSPDTITEGGGLSGMRQKAEPFSGKVSVSTSPQFTLTLELPGVSIL